MVPSSVPQLIAAEILIKLQFIQVIKNGANIRMTFRKFIAIPERPFNSRGHP
jgi:hypothetical protein